jgi:DNA-directed RNA polymerase subunit RPC12/RpoP
MADEMKCKYCGCKFIQGSCSYSPTKRHVGIPDGVRCVYCGVKFTAGGSCAHSPTKKHILG